MSAVVTTDRGVTCGICLLNFEPGQERVTHVGGEGHDGFHRNCLASWVITNQSCPYDRQPINLDCLVMRIDQFINQFLKRATPAISTSYFVGMTVAAGLGLAFGPEAIGTAAGVAAGVATAVIRGETDRLAARAGVRWGTIPGTPPQPVPSAALFGIQTGALAGVLAGVVAGAEGSEGLVAKALAGVALLSGLAGLGVTIMLSKTDPEVFGRIVHNIGPGMRLGGMAAIASEVACDQAGIVLTPLKAIIVGVLVGDIAASFFSRIKTVN